jgi:DNA-binding PadR family transcriptional regulator
MRPEQQLLHGPALAAALKLLERGPQSGYQLAAELRAECPQALAQGEASLLALFHYLEAHRLVAGVWQETDRGRRKMYTLTDHGRDRLAAETRQWQALATLFRRPEDTHDPLAMAREASA